MLQPSIDYHGNSQQCDTICYIIASKLLANNSTDRYWNTQHANQKSSVYRKTLDRSPQLLSVYKLLWPPACIQDLACIQDPASTRGEELQYKTHSQLTE